MNASPLLVVFLVVTSAGAPAVAWEPQPDAQAQPGLDGGLPAEAMAGQPYSPEAMAQAGAMTPGEIQKLFDAYLVMEAQQALELTEQQYPQFLTRLRTLQETRRRNQHERTQLMQQLQRLTNPRAPQRGDENMIRERLTALQELESRTAAEMRRAYNTLDEVLDVRQQARFRVFEEQIERRKIELLMRARQQNRPNQPRPNQPPPRRPNQPPG